jgi:DNA-binding MarR family transcriptional regulator
MSRDFRGACLCDRFDGSVIARNNVNRNDTLDIIILSERLYRQFLDRIQLELDILNIRDINNVRALILLNIGEMEMAVSDILSRGCYLGSNVSYNLRKLTEAGYVIQERSSHDKRVTMVRNSPKAAKLCGILHDMNDRQSAALTRVDCTSEDLDACRHTLRTLQAVWGADGEAEPGAGAYSSQEVPPLPRHQGGGRRPERGYSRTDSTLAAHSPAVA